MPRPLRPFQSQPRLLNALINVASKHCTCRYVNPNQSLQPQIWTRRTQIQCRDMVATRLGSGAATDLYARDRDTQKDEQVGAASTGYQPSNGRQLRQSDFERLHPT